MIGGDDLERAGLQARPQRVLMLLRAEGRRHDAAGGVVPILVAVIAFVEHEMLNQRLAENALAGLAARA